ncbi:MAG: hypothetical protein ACI4VR_02560 [Bacilli bacterium]
MKEKRIIYLIMGVCSISILLIGITTAWFTWQSEVDTSVTFEVSGLNITSSNTEITGTLYPTMDKNNGLVEEFTIKQNNNIVTPVCANITLTLTTLPTELNHESFRYKIYNGTNLVGSGNFANTLEGETITIATSQPITTTVSTYKLYIWIDGENYNNPLSMGGKTFLFKLGLTANQQQNACNPSTVEELNAPELVSGMIPIKYDGTNWVKAESTNASYDWYDYTNKMWANAVMVTSDTRDTYMSATAGTTVSEEDILAYYVWIPRYKYQLFNTGSNSSSVEPESSVKTKYKVLKLAASTNIDPIEIQIKFEEGIPNKSNGTANGDWLTHPAFTFGTDELKGIWVGKFSTTGSAEAPTSKPNLLPLTNQNVSSQFTTSQIFGTTTYLTSTGVSEVDAHMMKNIEWGAVAYLKQSKYGLGTTDIGWNNYFDETDFNNGGTNYLKTGCGIASGSEYSTTCNAYNITDGMLASTTGNITGVYDMSAVMGTYVMGVMKNSGGTNLTYSSSGFTTSTLPFNSKYVDQYEYGTTYNDQTAYNRRILGDATGEVASWYDDFSAFVISDASWFVRGYGSSGSPTVAGVFSFFGFHGEPFPNLAFRSVLAPGSVSDPSSETPDS